MGAFNVGLAKPAAKVQKSYGAGIVTDPRHLPLTLVDESITFKTGTGTASNLPIALPAGWVSTVVNSTSVFNLVSVTGAGYLCGVVTPATDTGATQVVTLIVNVDGVTSRIILSDTIAIQQRWVIGALAHSVAPSTVNQASTDTDFGFIGGYNDPGQSAKTAGGRVSLVGFLASFLLPSISQYAHFMLPRLRFERNLSISIQCSAVPGTLGTHSQKALVGYTLD